MAEHQRKYKARLKAEGKWTEAEKCKRYRARLNLKIEMAQKMQKEHMTAKKKLAQNERKRRQREKLRGQKKSSTTAATTPTTSATSSSSFGTRQSRGKALLKVRRSLPRSPRKCAEVCSVLASEAGFITTKRPWKERRQADLDARIVEFYRSDPISRATPGKKDSRMFKLPDGSRVRRQLRYMTMSIGEAYEAFKGEVGVNLGKSKFFSLRPPEVLHERDIPASVCVCRVHSDMDGLLSGLAKTFSGAIPATGRELLAATVCNRESEPCMLVDCDKCKENLGNLINDLVIDSDVQVGFSTWEEGASGYLHVVRKEVPPITALEMLEDKYIKYAKHCYIKDQQEKYFQHTKAALMDNECVMQVDFAENYACVMQDEIQSAHWRHRQVSIPISIFTIFLLFSIVYIYVHPYVFKNMITS